MTVHKEDTMGKPLKKIGDFLKDNGLDLLGKVISGSSPASVVLDIVTDALGLDKGKTEEEYVSLIKADPDAFVKLREVELTHKVELQKLALQQEQMYVDDVKSARTREVDVVKATKEKDWFLYGLASLVVVGFFSVLVVLMFVQLPKDSTGTVQLLFGALSMGFGGILQYFFGSSKGSADKTLMMNETGKGK
jgi:hypothetical protein